MNKIKKIIAAALVLCMALALTGCGGPAMPPVPELTVSETAKDPDMNAYEDNFDGIISYLKDSEVLAGDGINMSADFIGAEKGQKFLFKYNEAPITCEIYEFDTANLNDKAKVVLESVKKNGSFQSLDATVEATVSDSGKFVMVYTCPEEDDNEILSAMTVRAEEKLKTFKGGK